MVSLDQVYLLEQKVESAVAKIQQLQAENDALRSKCSELTNALSAKSEQLSNFESDQSQIENGIKKALDRLNSIENSVLKTAEKVNQADQAAKPAPSFNTMEKVPETKPEPQPEPEEEVVQDEEPAETQDEESVNTPEQALTQNFIEDTFDSEEEETDVQDDDNHDGLGFDIF